MTDEPSAMSARRPSLHGSPARRRALCIWLGTLASWRSGLVKKLVRECGTVSRVLDAPPEKLAALIGAPGVAQRSRKVHPTTAAQGLDRAGERHAAERDAEEQRFAAALGARAEDLARMQERFSHSAVVAWCDPLYPPALRQLADLWAAISRSRAYSWSAASPWA
jgi:hypothetical protein